LLLLTDDGELARKVAHPSGGYEKEYRVKVSGVPAEKDLDRLRHGIYLDGERTRPCEIERISTTGGRDKGNTWLRVTLREGRSRQIRRMFETSGHLVSKLRRVAIGPLRDRGLPPGSWRWLESWEVEALRAAPKTAAAPTSKNRSPARRRD
jgi:23S rRNA pseudouridine2605 synthase